LSFVIARHAWPCIVRMSSPRVGAIEGSNDGSRSLKQIDALLARVPGHSWDCSPDARWLPSYGPVNGQSVAVPVGIR